MWVPPPDRRHFLRTLGSAAAALCLPPFLRGEAELPDNIVRLSVLHTTDLHGHILPTSDYSGNGDLGGLARCATQIGRWRAENPNSLLIDIGDVYEGTPFGWNDRGRAMIELFNLLRYDAWIVGNHEFDWGIEPFLDAVRCSEMPVLAANTRVEGVPSGDLADRQNPLAKVQPFLLKEIAGIRLAIIGLTTPGMPFWFPSRFTGGIEFQAAIEPARRAITRARSLGADAVILAGHMGLKERTGGDDFANQVMGLTSEFPNVAAFIAGHTHQHISSRLTNRIILTQADHFGIHLGRLELFFERSSRKLLRQEAHCELMDSRIPLDPVVLSRSQPQLREADALLTQPIGELAETLHVRAAPCEASELERLIAAAITEALGRIGVVVDGVFHGLFDRKHVWKAGSKTIADAWEILPYENYLVTGELTSEQIKLVMNEVLQTREPRSLTGFRCVLGGNGRERSLIQITLPDGRPLERQRRYRIAFNSFDSRSAGHRFIKLRDLLELPETSCTFHSVQTREALIEYFRRHKVIRRASFADAGRLPAAAAS